MTLVFAVIVTSFLIVFAGGRCGQGRAQEIARHVEVETKSARLCATASLVYHPIRAVHVDDDAWYLVFVIMDTYLLKTYFSLCDHGRLVFE